MEVTERKPLVKPSTEYFQTTVDRAESPVVPVKEWKEAKRYVVNRRVREAIKNPLTLVLLTWFIMAILLWWEIITAS